MISGLYGHSLAEVKEYWKKTSNGQSSFARNPEATRSWLASLPEHPASDRLKKIVNFLPDLLGTKPLDRPSAQAVVNRLSNLAIFFPRLPVNSCCGPFAWIDELWVDRIGGSGSSIPPDQQFWSDFRGYLQAATNPEMTYVILDHEYKQVASKDDFYLIHPHNPLRSEEQHPYLADWSAIKEACAMLFPESSMMRHAITPIFNTSSAIPIILQKYSTWQTIFTALRGKVRPPEQRLQPESLGYSRMEWPDRTIQVSMVGLGHQRYDESYFGAVAYVLAFRISDGPGYEPSELGVPFVDLASLKSSWASREQSVANAA